MEYETIGVVVVVVGLVSYQIKLVSNRLKEEIDNAKETHKGFYDRLNKIENKLSEISKHLGVY